MFHFFPHFFFLNIQKFSSNLSTILWVKLFSIFIRFFMLLTKKWTRNCFCRISDFPKNRIPDIRTDTGYPAGFRISGRTPNIRLFNTFKKKCLPNSEFILQNLFVKMIGLCLKGLFCIRSDIQLFYIGIRYPAEYLESYIQYWYPARYRYRI